MTALRLLVLAGVAVVFVALLVRLGQRDEVDCAAFDAAAWRVGEDRAEGARFLAACRPYRGQSRAFVRGRLGEGSLDHGDLYYSAGEDDAGWDQMLVAEFDRSGRLVG